MRNGFLPFMQALYPYMTVKQDRMLFRKVFMGIMALAVVTASRGILAERMP